MQPYLDINHHLIPEMFYGVHIRIFGWPIHGFQILVLKETTSGSVCVGRIIILDQDKVVLEGGSCPGWATLLQHACTLACPWCRLAHLLTFAIIVESSPYDDRWTDIIIWSLPTDINVPLTLPPVYRARPPVRCNLNLDSSVKVQCRQWRMSLTHWRLAYWRWCRRCLVA